MDGAPAVSSSEAEPHELHYAPSTPSRRLHLVRWLLLSALLAAVVLSLRWAPILWRRARILYWQRQCMTYDAPQDAPVTGYRTRGRVTITVIPEPWQKLSQLLSPFGGVSSCGTAFLHERMSPSGHRRLVAVDLHLPGPLTGHDTGLECDQNVLVPGGILSEPTASPYLHGGWLPPQAVMSAGYSLTVFPMPIDTIDQSHIRFRVQEQNEELIVDGWLRDDDIVVFDPPRPATPPAPPSTASSP
jgi:hypothetical protein